MQELSEWKPKSPRIAAVGEYLKRVRDASLLGSLVAGNKGDLLEKVAYGDRLTTGKGETLGLHPDVTELADVIPSGSTLAKGAKMASLIGPVGLANLGDETLSRWYEKALASLKKMDPKDWRGQKEVVESMGMVPIARGRDIPYTAPTIKFGYELPEVTVSTKGLGRITDDPVMIGEAKLPELMEGNRLFRAYPRLREAIVRGDPKKEIGSASVDYYSDPFTITLGPQKTSQQARRAMGHEIQHPIQRMEGWPQGTNQVAARILLHELARTKGFPVEAVDPKWKKQVEKQADLLRYWNEGTGGRDLTKARENAALLMYLREAGEQQAEAVGQRMAKRHGEGGVSGVFEKFYTAPFREMYDRRAYPVSFE